ncbi:hypothetical protein FOA52_012075, partial [Chlamydomonas sp. UWO 241]
MSGMGGLHGRGRQPVELDLDLLVSVCSDLGSVYVNDAGEKRYRKSDDCLGCLKDLQRFLRNDDPDLRTVFFKLASFETPRTDLLPLLTTYPGDEEIVTAALKVLTFLTMPVNPTSADPGRQLEAQRAIKVMFCKAEAVAVVLSLVTKPLSRHPRMSKDDASTVQLVLSFLRNLLQVPDEVWTQGQVSKSGIPQRLQQVFLSTLFAEHAMELIGTVCSHAGSRPFRDELPTLLSLVSAILSGVGPRDLAGVRAPTTVHRRAAPAPAAQQAGPAAGGGGGARGGGQQCPDWDQPPPSQQEQQAPQPPPGPTDAVLEGVLAARRAQRAGMLAAGPRLHSRARGTFVRQHGEHSEKVVYLANRFDKAELVAAPPPPAVTKPLDADADAIPSTLGSDVLWQMRGWVVEMLAGGYNVMMGAARRELEPGLGISMMDADDYANFLRVVHVFTGFARRMQQPAPAAAAAAAAAEAAEGGEGEQ